MPQTVNGVVVPVGGDLAYAPDAFKGAADNGNFVAQFPNLTTRDAWSGPPDGAICVVRDSNLIYQFVDGAWVQVGSIVRTFATTTDRDTNWTSPPDGALSMTLDTGTLWIRRSGAWHGPVFVDLNVTGAAVVGGTLNVAGAAGVAGALTAAQLVTQSNLVFPFGHAISAPDAATLRLQDGGGGVATVDVEANRTRITNQPIGNNWDHRALVLQKFTGVGEVGLGFFNHQSATGGSIQLYTPPAGATEFYFVNANNSGTLGIRCGAVNGASSRRYKERIQPAPPIDVTRLEPVAFQYLGEARTRFGLIAEDVERIAPEVSDGDTIDHAGLMALMLQEIKSLRARLDQLEAA